MDLPDLSKGADIGNRQSCLFFFLLLLIYSKIILAPIKTLSQIISEGLGLGDKPDYVSVKAMSTLIKKDTAVYMVKKKHQIFLVKKKNFIWIIDVSRR